MALLLVVIVENALQEWQGQVLVKNIPGVRENIAQSLSFGVITILWFPKCFPT